MLVQCGPPAVAKFEIAPVHRSGELEERDKCGIVLPGLLQPERFVKQRISPMVQKTAVSAGAIVLREIDGELKVALAQRLQGEKIWVLQFL